MEGLYDYTCLSPKLIMSRVLEGLLVWNLKKGRIFWLAMAVFPLPMASN